VNEHEDIRKLLPLAAAGTISPADVRRVGEHLAHCEPCRWISEDFAALESALRGLPTPQPRAELIARVRDLAESRLADRKAWSRDTAILAPLVAGSWIVALVTWPVAQAAGRWVLTAWYVQGDGLGTALAVYSILGFLLACAAAIAVGRRAGAIGRVR
jgi:hypothetical protein